MGVGDPAGMQFRETRAPRLILGHSDLLRLKKGSNQFQLGEEQNPGDPEKDASRGEGR